MGSAPPQDQYDSEWDAWLVNGLEDNWVKPCRDVLLHKLGFMGIGVCRVVPLIVVLITLVGTVALLAYFGNPPKDGAKPEVGAKQGGAKKGKKQKAS